MSLPHSSETDGARLSGSSYGRRQWAGWILGPGLFLICLLAPPPAGLSPEGWRTVGAAALMAVFWITEPIPIPATSLLPMALFPLLGLSNIRDSAAPYANPIIYLFLAGFLLALAMERWNLHRRIAINLIAWIGVKPRRIIAGFLLSSALISMWVSNTATALMMLPIAMSVVRLIPEHERSQPAMRAFAAALLLSVAYGSTTGGMATLIGTPTNALLAAFMEGTYGVTIGFGPWMLVGVPLVLATLPVVFLILTRVAFRLDYAEVPGLSDLLREEKQRLGRFSRGETTVAIVFGLTAVGWVSLPLVTGIFPLLTDTVVGMIGALVLFMIPVDLRARRFAMDWESARRVPWDVLLLFGGGLSLAASIEKHGVARFLGEMSAGLNAFPVILTMAVVAFGILMLTELTSNTATAAAFLPVVAAIAISLGQNPLLLMAPTAFAANCAYMMPVGTPPNAIVYGSGLITLPEMAKAGWWLNVLLVPIILVLVLLIGPMALGIELDVLPDWIRP